MHVTKVYFIQLAHEVKYVEFEDRSTNFFIKTYKRMSYHKLLENTMLWTLDDFLRKLQTTGSIERTVMIDFKMCWYIVFVLQGSVETQLGWSGKFY